MPFRKLTFKLIPSLLVVLAIVGLAGAAVLARAPHHALSTAISPASSPQTTAVPTSPTATPATVPGQSAVAGAATQAPKPAVANVATTAPAHSPVPAPTPCATPAGDTVSLTIKFPGSTLTCNVSIGSGADACTVLHEAYAEGKITTLTIYDSPDYIASHGKSAYVYDINHYTDAWTYSAQGPSGQPLPAYGCSLTPILAGDSVIWKYN